MSATRYFPGPRNRLLTTYRVLRYPFTFCPRWETQYGDPVLLPCVNGDIVLTGRADLIQQIFSASPENYGVFGTEAMAPLVGPNSLLTMEGEHHRRDRKLLMPPFHGQRMRTYAETIQHISRQHFDRATARGETDVMTVAQAITLEVILRTVMGVDDPEELEDLAKALVEIIDAAHPAFLFAPFLQREFGGFGPWADFVRKRAHGDALLDQRIGAARQKNSGDDILSLMVNSCYDDGAPMSDAAIKDELCTMLVAGHETTAITLAFAVDYVFRNTAELDRISADAEGAAGDPSQQAKLVSIRGVIRETLRLRPVLTESLRKLNRPVTLDGVELPAGVVLAASAVLAHNNPDVYPEPQEFRPTRFEGRAFSPFEYLPFGGGHRRCIGAAFAEMELQIALATLLAEYEVELLAPLAKPVRRNVTIAPAGNVPIRIHKRKSRAAPGFGRQIA
ncbi:MAG: cytochrome P450 [Myxococcota bacterium]